MDDDLAAAASLTSSGKTSAPRKAAAPKPKKVLTAEQRANEPAKRKDRRHAADAREEAAAVVVAQQQVGLDLDGFPVDHEFSEDYGLEEEDECDIDLEPLFEDELANQAVGTKPKRKSKWTKAYTSVEDKLLCKCWRDIG
ncbi:Helicase SKI2W [Hordeum vulgare]|nr:Helicase SKI2W [Hordeum vulgare]